MIEASKRSVGSVSRSILLVEDEPGLVVTLTDRLESEGYQVYAVTSGEDALQVTQERSFDLVILDVMLPGMDGFDVCRELRQERIQVPILMLTARSQVVDRVVGLKLGADDYLTKPFEMIELLARIEVLFRRGRSTSVSVAEVYEFGDVRVDLKRAEISRGGESVELSALEFKLLRHFVQHRGELLSRDELLDRVWGYDATPYTRTVDVHIASLRQKVEVNPSHPEFIITVHGLGYKFMG
jgi:two-component system alkaline phosphatase synthesis response regulator PhoP